MERLTITPSPHLHAKTDTASIMRDVLIALCPALIASALVFGYRALQVTLVCVIACVGFEYMTRKLLKRDQTISDLSAVVTGVLLAFNLPVTIPLWIAVIGCFFAIVVVKQLFGGIGQNFANPAITARVVLFISFAGQMTHWVTPIKTFEELPTRFMQTLGVDTVTTATPLMDIAGADTVSLFWGTVGGCLGETSAFALLLGGLYLVLRKVIAPTIPLVYIGTVFVFSHAIGASPVNQIFAGGLMIGAIFMATDYATSPMTTKGKIMFALGCGFLTVIIRVYANFPEGVSFAILFMNVMVPVIDRYTKTRPFGTKIDKTAEGKA